MLFHLLSKGYSSKYKAPTFSAEREIKIAEGLPPIKKKDISEMFASENIDLFNSAYEAADACKHFGLPYSGGWAEQPAVLMDAIQLIRRCEEEVKK